MLLHDVHAAERMGHLSKSCRPARYRERRFRFNDRGRSTLRALLILLAAVAVIYVSLPGLHLAPSAARAAGKPNIVLILTDDLDSPTMAAPELADLRALVSDSGTS